MEVPDLEKTGSLHWQNIWLHTEMTIKEHPQIIDVSDWKYDTVSKFERNGVHNVLLKMGGDTYNLCLRLIEL